MKKEVLTHTYILLVVNQSRVFFFSLLCVRAVAWLKFKKTLLRHTYMHTKQASKHDDNMCTLKGISTYVHTYVYPYKAQAYWMCLYSIIMQIHH